MTDEKKTKTEVLKDETIGNKHYTITKKTTQNDNPDYKPSEMAYISVVSLKDDGTPFTEQVKLENGQTRFVPQERTYFMPSKTLAEIISLFSEKKKE